MKRFEFYQEQAAKCIISFLNNERNYTDTIKDMKVTFNLDAQQEASIRIVLTELDFMDEHIDHDNLVSFVGFNVNIIAHILLKEWDTLNAETLK